MLVGRVDGEEEKGEKKAIIINNIKIVIAIAIYTPPLIALYYI